MEYINRSYESKLEQRMTALGIKYKKEEKRLKEEWAAQRDDAAKSNEPFDMPEPIEPEITEAEDVQLIKEYFNYFAFGKRGKKMKVRNIKDLIKKKFNITIST